MRRLSRAVGEFQMAIGALHTLVGILLFREQLAAIGRDGVGNAVDPHADRQAAFWFLTSGALIVTSGQLARWAQRRTGMLPAAFGWNTLAIGVAGVVVMPISGFWLVIAQALFALAASRRGGAGAAAPAAGAVRSDARL